MSVVDRVVALLSSAHNLSDHHFDRCRRPRFEAENFLRNAAFRHANKKVFDFQNSRAVFYTISTDCNSARYRDRSGPEVGFCAKLRSLFRHWQFVIIRLLTDRGLFNSSSTFYLLRWYPLISEGWSRQKIIILQRDPKSLFHTAPSLEDYPFLRDTLYNASATENCLWCFMSPL